MNKDALVEKLGEFSTILNGICGRMIVASRSNEVISEAHEMGIQLGIGIDDLINELLGTDAT